MTTTAPAAIVIKAQGAEQRKAADEAESAAA
jgi:hypothetical protein